MKAEDSGYPSEMHMMFEMRTNALFVNCNAEILCTIVCWQQVCIQIPEMGLAMNEFEPMRLAHKRPTNLPNAPFGLRQKLSEWHTVWDENNLGTG